MKYHDNVKLITKYDNLLELVKCKSGLNPVRQLDIFL